MPDVPARIDLSPDERALLVELLDRAFRDLRDEIYRTEDHAYKEGLKARQQVLLALLDKVGARPE